MPTLILLPGMDGTGNLFGSVAAHLSKLYDVKVVSYPSQVIVSPTRVLDRIYSEIETSKPVILIAESYSTFVAIQFAAKHPENLVGLVLCAGFATSPVNAWFRHFVRNLAPILFRSPLPAWLVRRLLLNQEASDGLVDSVRTAIASVKAEVLSSRLVEIALFSALPELSEVNVPILYLRAEQDRLIPVRCLVEIKRVQPKIQVVSVAGPHLILQAKPERSAQVILEFVRYVS